MIVLNFELKIPWFLKNTVSLELKLYLFSDIASVLPCVTIFSLLRKYVEFSVNIITSWVSSLITTFLDAFAIFKVLSYSNSSALIVSPLSRAFDLPFELNLSLFLKKVILSDWTIIFLIISSISALPLAFNILVDLLNLKLSAFMIVLFPVAFDLVFVKIISSFFL